MPWFGWSVYVPGGGVLFAIAGDNAVDSNANWRASEIAKRIATHGPGLVKAPLGEIYAAKVPASDDYSVFFETCDEDNKLVTIELITIDKPTAKPYGAYPKQLAAFWADRLKGFIIQESWPLATMDSELVPMDCLKAARVNWRAWKAADSDSDD